MTEEAGHYYRQQDCTREWEPAHEGTQKQSKTKRHLEGWSPSRKCGHLLDQEEEWVDTSSEEGGGEPCPSSQEAVALVQEGGASP